MKLFGALAVGVLLATGSAFGASIINSATLTTLCTSAGSNCGNVTFNQADQDISAPLFGPLGIVGTNGSTLRSLPFQGGVPFQDGGPTGNLGNGLLSATSGSYIDISVDAGNLSAIGFMVDQGIYGDGQGMQFTLFFQSGSQSLFGGNPVILDGCVGGGGAVLSCPTFIGFQAGGGEQITKIRISNATNDSGPERFNLYNLRYVVAGDPPVNPIPEPASFGLMGAALLGLGAYRKFRK